MRLRRPAATTGSDGGSITSGGSAGGGAGSSSGAASTRSGSRGLATAPAGCSLLVVAHRLDTVANADKLLVMSQGRVLEQGPPAVLAAQKGGVYAAMLQVMREAEGAAAAAAVQQQR